MIGDVAYVGVIGPKNGTIGYDADNGKRVYRDELGEYNPAISDGKRLYLTGYNVVRGFLPRLNPGGDKGKKGGGKKDGGGGGSKKQQDKKRPDKKGSEGNKTGRRGRRQEGARRRRLAPPHRVARYSA